MTTAPTSRCIAILVNPDTDNIADKTIAFPSFSLLHLWVDDGALNCTTFFRKQEMTYWLAVSVAKSSVFSPQDLLILHGNKMRQHSDLIFDGQL